MIIQKSKDVNIGGLYVIENYKTYCYLYPHPVCHISFNAQNLHTSGSNFCKGADVSWLSEMEANGYKFYNDDGLSRIVFKF